MYIESKMGGEKFMVAATWGHHVSVGTAVVQPARNRAGWSEFTGVDYAGGIGGRILTLRGGQFS